MGKERRQDGGGEKNKEKEREGGGGEKREGKGRAGKNRQLRVVSMNINSMRRSELCLVS